MTDLALRLLRDGYGAVEKERRRRDGGDTFVARLTGRRAVVVRGADGARLFYDESVVMRNGAIPPPIAKLLFGAGAVHSLDDEAHRARKQMFLEQLPSERVAGAAERAGEALARAVKTWPGREVGVFPELVDAYGGAVLGWAGIDVSRDRANELSRQLAMIVDGFGGAPVAYARAWVARRRLDDWARGLVAAVRDGEREAPEGSVLAALAANTELDATTAGVELLNVLRPTVAVAWLGTFAALALDSAPEWQERLATGPDSDRVAFAQEVRRTTPFAPALAGRVRREARHAGIRLRPGDMVVLDILGTNRHPGAWPHPHLFRPERFLDREVGRYELVPQGGGPPAGHRCPGEPLTIMLLAETLRALASVRYTVVSRPVIDLRRIPTLPTEGLRIRVERG